MGVESGEGGVNRWWGRANCKDFLVGLGLIDLLRYVACTDFQTLRFLIRNWSRGCNTFWRRRS